MAASADEAFYGLKVKPFAAAADPRFFYHGTLHDAVVQQLLTAIRRREDVILLIGDSGLGKTTMCRVVLDQLDRRTLTSHVADPVATPEGLLAQILVDFGVLSWKEAARGSATRPELRTALQSFVDSLGPLGATAIVVVDEAQSLPADVFEEVRTLCEAAHASSRLQVVLVGQHALSALLRRKENRALRQRVAACITIEPLAPEEIGDYIAHRLGVAGNARVEFKHEALAHIYEATGGVPGVINRLCDRVLTRACRSGTDVITDAIVESAASDLDLGAPLSGLLTTLARVTAALFVIAFLLIGAAMAGWVFRDALARSVLNWQLTPAPPDAPRRLPQPLVPPPTQAVERPPA